MARPSLTRCQNWRMRSKKPGRTRVEETADGAGVLIDSQYKTFDGKPLEADMMVSVVVAAQGAAELNFAEAETVT
jgi:hypothetical protein